MASATIEIITTRDIARQILRHRSFSFQEFSQRYAEVGAIGTGLEFVFREARLQDFKNRQNSIPIEEQDVENRYIALQWERKQKELIDWVDNTYRWALENGIAKEQVKPVLRVGAALGYMFLKFISGHRNFLVAISCQGAIVTLKENGHEPSCTVEEPAVG